MTNNKAEKMQHTYPVSGMHCGGCAGTVEQKLTSLPEVDSVRVKLEKQQVEITSEIPVPLGTLQAVLENTTYAIKEPIN